jgi:XTP/dITP diphosphohydrolase
VTARRGVIATFNRDKRLELAALLAIDGIEWETLADVPGAAPPEEDGTTLLDNARIKARAALALTGLLAVADDTGFEVDALGGRPGVHAARYAGPQATYADNVLRLLGEMDAVPDAARTARFRTVCVACMPDGREWSAEGVLEGRVIRAPRGAHGFGYDPVFVPEGEARTLAEIEPAEKNRMSHRARALTALANALRNVLVPERASPDGGAAQPRFTRN